MAAKAKERVGALSPLPLSFEGEGEGLYLGLGLFRQRRSGHRDGDRGRAGGGRIFGCQGGRIPNQQQRENHGEKRSEA